MSFYENTRNENDPYEEAVLHNNAKLIPERV